MDRIHKPEENDVYSLNNFDKLRDAILRLTAIYKKQDLEIKKVKDDIHFLTELIMKEKSFTEDVKVKLNKILDWTKSKTG